MQSTFSEHSLTENKKHLTEVFFVLCEAYAFTGVVGAGASTGVGLSTGVVGVTVVSSDIDSFWINSVKATGAVYSIGHGIPNVPS